MRYLTTGINRFFAEEGKMAFVAGPRQVGKRTMPKHLLFLVVAEYFPSLPPIFWHSLTVQHREIILGPFLTLEKTPG